MGNKTPHQFARTPVLGRDGLLAAGRVVGAAHDPLAARASGRDQRRQHGRQDQGSPGHRTPHHLARFPVGRRHRDPGSRRVVRAEGDPRLRRVDAGHFLGRTRGPRGQVRRQQDRPPGVRAAHHLPRHPIVAVGQFEYRRRLHVGRRHLARAPVHQSRDQRRQGGWQAHRLARLRATHLLAANPIRPWYWKCLTRPERRDHQTRLAGHEAGLGHHRHGAVGRRQAGVVGYGNAFLVADLGEDLQATGQRLERARQHLPHQDVRLVPQALGRGEGRGREERRLGHLVADDHTVEQGHESELRVCPARMGFVGADGAGHRAGGIDRHPGAHQVLPAGPGRQVVQWVDEHARIDARIVGQASVQPPRLALRQGFAATAEQAQVEFVHAQREARDLVPGQVVRRPRDLRQEDHRLVEGQDAAPRRHHVLQGELSEVLGHHDEVVAEAIDLARPRHRAGNVAGPQVLDELPQVGFDLRPLCLVGVDEKDVEDVAGRELHGRKTVAQGVRFAPPVIDPVAILHAQRRGRWRRNHHRAAGHGLPHRLQPFLHLLHAADPPARVFLEHVGQQASQIGMEERRQERLVRFRAQVPLMHLRQPAHERAVAQQQIPQGDGQRIGVAALVQAVFLDLLGAGEQRAAAERLARERGLRDAGRGHVLQFLHRAEIREFDHRGFPPGGLVEQQVGRLDVAVREVHLVHGPQPGRRLQRQLDQFALGDPAPPPRIFLEVAAPAKLHGIPDLVAAFRRPRLALPQVAHHVRVAHQAQHLQLAEELPLFAMAVEPPRLDDLDRHKGLEHLPEHLLPEHALVGRARCSFPEHGRRSVRLGEDLVLAEGKPFHGHGGVSAGDQPHRAAGGAPALVRGAATDEPVVGCARERIHGPAITVPPVPP